ncbi:spore germination protein [Bacillus sp. AFS017336]|nr:spore germination protein [Bacillus sp. AFS002410]PEL13099.1 spore germination protein [Bacillus sp. AFS017336]
MNCYMRSNKYKQNYQNSNIVISGNLDLNIENVKKSLLNSSDLTTRNLMFQDKKIVVVYINTIVGRETLETQVIQQIINNSKDTIPNTVAIKDVKSSDSFDECILSIVKGKTVIFIEDEKSVFILETTSFENRSIEQPSSEQTIRGSHDGLVECIITNINQIRRRISNPNLVVKTLSLGVESDTCLAVLYIDTIANEDLVKEVHRRLSYVDVDYVHSPGNLEEFIEDNPYSPFPQLLTTERSDRIAGNLMEGKIAILTDGSPSALVLPITFFSFYQSPDDYNSRWMVASFARILRLVSFLIAISLPALYIALVSFHFEIIPIDLVFNVKSSLENVPYPPLVEALGMQITLELLRESAIRLPNPIAQTLGVVGGLVIGTAVVQANLVSNTMIVVISLTAIASFVVPDNEIGTSVRLLGFPLMFAASLIGLIGIVFGLSIILIHLCKLESFGSPYFAPFAPFRKADLKDTVVRAPLWKMKKRPFAPLPKKFNRENNSRGWENDEK